MYGMHFFFLSTTAGTAKFPDTAQPGSTTANLDQFFNYEMYYDFGDDLVPRS